MSEPFAEMNDRVFSACADAACRASANKDAMKSDGVSLDMVAPVGWLRLIATAHNMIQKGMAWCRERQDGSDGIPGSGYSRDSSGRTARVALNPDEGYDLAASHRPRNPRGRVRLVRNR